MTFIKDWCEAIWEYVTKGSVEQILITCNEQNYDMCMDIKRDMHEDTDTGVRLCIADEIVVDDTRVAIHDDTIVFSYFHEGNIIFKPCVSMYTFNVNKEEKQ
jgi:hypothetical protein